MIKTIVMTTMVLIKYDNIKNTPLPGINKTLCYMILSVNLILGDDCFEDGLAYISNNVVSRQNFQIGMTPQQCQKACNENTLCKFWSLHKRSGKCYLKTRRANIKESPDYMSASKNCGPNN